MYINLFHVQIGLRTILETNVDLIGGEVRRFFPSRTINLFVGRRNTIPATHMPSLEIIGQGFTPEWYASRTQNVTYRIELILTVPIEKEEAVDLIVGTVSTAVCFVLTNPAVLQFSVQSEKRLEQSAPSGFEYIRLYNEDKDLEDRLVWTAPEPDTTQLRKMTDSFVTDVSYNTSGGGAYAQANMTWEGQMLQPYVGNWRYFHELLVPGLPAEITFP